MQKIVNSFLVSSVLFLSGTLSLPSSDDGSEFRRSDLFLDEPFFLGIPNLAKTPADSLDLDVDSGSGSAQSQLALQSKLNVGKNRKINKTSSHSAKWPGRENTRTIKNAGADLVKVFKENLKRQQEQKAENSKSDDLAETIANQVDECENKCRGFEIPSEKRTCLFNCATQNNSLLSVLSYVLYQGIKSLCHTVNTFYSNFDKLRVNNLETFQAVMKKIESPMPVSGNIPLITMLATLISDIFSPMAPFRPLLVQFKKDLADLEASQILKPNVLVGPNPGCSMVDLKNYIQTAIEVLVKDPSLSDYIMLQGYALFTALTKYVDEFTTKKEFAVLNQGLDMMIGTTCGLVLYAATGETSNCDQLGGYPVLNMPVPEFVWSNDLHASCQEVKEKMLLNKQTENERRKRESVVAAAVAAESAALSESKEVNQDKGKIRRRRSLAVGRN